MRPDPRDPRAVAAGPPSLRRRISRYVLLLSLTWIVVATLVLALWLRHEVDELLDDGLVATSEALALVWQIHARESRRRCPRRCMRAFSR